MTSVASIPTQATLMGIPSGVGGVRATLKLMVNLARTYKTDIHVRSTAVNLVAGNPVTLPNGRIAQYSPCEPKDRACEVTTLQHFVRDAVRYVADVQDVETIQTPVQTLKVMSGDCDDKATLFAALAASIGFATRFCAIGVRGGPFSHVMAQVRLGQSWLNAETILPDVELGWFPPDATCHMLAHV